MSRSMPHDLGCVCGRYFSRALYHAIDASIHPGLRYAILGDVLNVVQCPSCERVVRINLPFSYHDDGHRRLIYVYPEEHESIASGAGEGSAVRIVDPVMDPIDTLESVARPAALMSITGLAKLVAEDLADDEEMAAIFFDVRPSKISERAARLLTTRIAVGVGGYVHSWREGGRLHLQIIGPSDRLDEVTADPGDE